MSAGDSSSSKSSSRSSASSTSRCALLSTASLLLPLSAVVLALLYTSLPIRWPLHTDSDATVSFVTETLSDSDLKAQMRPVQKGRHLPASSTSSLGTTFLDRLNQTRLNDVITLRFGSENNRSNEHFKRRFISLDELNRFISVQMLPRLKSIVSMDYFRYIKLNLNRKCALWPDDTRCSLKYAPHFASLF